MPNNSKPPEPEALSKNNGFTLGFGYSDELRDKVTNAPDKYRPANYPNTTQPTTLGRRHISKNKY